MLSQPLRTRRKIRPFGTPSPLDGGWEVSTMHGPVLSVLVPVPSVLMPAVLGQYCQFKFKYCQYLSVLVPVLVPVPVPVPFAPVPLVPVPVSIPVPVYLVTGNWSKSLNDQQTIAQLHSVQCTASPSPRLISKTCSPALIAGVMCRSQAGRTGLVKAKKPSLQNTTLLNVKLKLLFERVNSAFWMLMPG